MAASPMRSGRRVQARHCCHQFVGGNSGLDGGRGAAGNDLTGTGFPWLPYHAFRANTEHTSNTGYQHSRVSWLKDSGIAAGSSVRYNGAAASLGQSVWVVNATAANPITNRVGFVTGEHTRNDAYQ